MRIFAEEETGSKDSKIGASVIIIGEKESRILLDMVEEACKLNKRKRTWTGVKEQLDKSLCCYRG